MRDPVLIKFSKEINPGNTMIDYYQVLSIDNLKNTATFLINELTKVKKVSDIYKEWRNKPENSYHGEILFYDDLHDKLKE